MKKVALISHAPKQGQTAAFMVAVELRKEKGELGYEVELFLHPNHKEGVEAFKPDFAILSPETVVWQKEITKFLDDLGIPYSIAKGSDYATRQVEKIFSHVK